MLAVVAVLIVADRYVVRALAAATVIVGVAVAVVGVVIVGVAAAAAGAALCLLAATRPALLSSRGHDVAIFGPLWDHACLSKPQKMLV